MKAILPRFLFSFLLSVLLSAIVVSAPAVAKPKEKEICLYQTRSGVIQQTNSRDDVPFDYRSTARCQPATQNENLAKPEEIKLSGNQRSENISSSLGEIQLRWLRQNETLFGRTPLRAMTDAANTVSRALKNPAFPTAIQNLQLPWKVVFMDENMPEGQIPSALVSNCHPGWMTPPANIYIVSQRVAGGCGGQRSSTSVADATLAQVLVHEMGHAVEYYLLQQKASLDRVRAEGFATWFERYAAQYSSILNPRDITKLQFQAAKYAISKSPTQFNFTGTFEDYSRASLYFSAITEPRGLQGLIDVYQTMVEKNQPLLPAINSTLNWDEKRLTKEVADLLKGY